MTRSADAMDGETLLEIRDLELGYGRAPVLRGVSLSVRSGEFWFFLGPNGTGKTTLVRAVLGLLLPRRGRLVRNPRLAPRERLGFVPQRCEPNPGLPTTVREFVSLGFVGSGIPRAERAAELEGALARVGLEALSDRSYWALSGGQRQRALVARALVRRARFLILDEPTEALDVGAEEAFLETLERLRAEEGLTLLVVTHELELAFRHATHLALFHGGTVEAGPRAEMARPERLREVFGVEIPVAGGPGPAAASGRRGPA